MTTHRGCGTPEYTAWERMKDRCRNPNSKDYKNYGGRGIRVCDRWKNFQYFLDDVGKKPSPEHTIDRINNDGNYEPGNVRWATRTVQNRNKRVSNNNTSGIKGVHWRKESQNWIVRINDGSKRVHIGCFKIKQEAIKARQEAEEKLWQNQ